jgi:hypothetical protein
MEDKTDLEFYYELWCDDVISHSQWEFIKETYKDDD